MRPEIQLAIVVAFTGFLLKTSLGFCICWAMSKVVVSPRGRFLLWFAFLIGAGCYWLSLAGNLVPHGSPAVALETSEALASSALMGAWNIPDSWAFSLSFLLRGLGALYLIVLGCFLSARIKKHMHLRWMLRFAYSAPEGIEDIFRPIAESLDASQVRLLTLSGIHSPATFGWLRPTILLPPLCLDQDESELGDIFRHELQHVRRRDFAFNAIASLCRALLFFHPAVWYAMLRLKLEGELACDLAVVSDSPEKRVRYAECLVRFARLNAAPEPTPWNLDFAGSSGQLQVRVRSMLTETRTIPGWLLGVRTALGLALFAGFLAVAPSLFIVLSYEQQRTAQPAESSRLATPADTQPHGTLPARLQGRPLRTSHTLATSSPTTPATAPGEASADPTQIMPPQIMPRRADPALSGEPGPTLHRRSEAAGAATPKPASSTTILLSSEPSHSADSIARRASVASAITAGASEAVGLASHGRDRDDH